jgi:hypothetical protein
LTVDERPSVIHPGRTAPLGYSFRSQQRAVEVLVVRIDISGGGRLHAMLAKIYRSDPEGETWLPTLKAGSTPARRLSIR